MLMSVIKSLSAVTVDFGVDELRQTHDGHKDDDYCTEQAETLLPREDRLVLVHFPMEDNRDDETDDGVDGGSCKGDRIANLVYQD